MELASPIGTGWQKVVGQLQEAILPAQMPADIVPIQLPNPMDIGRRCRVARGMGTSIEWLRVRAYEAGVIPTRARSGNDRRKTEERSRRSKDPSP